MKNSALLIIVSLLTLLIMLFGVAGCSSVRNAWDNLGGGGTGTVPETAEQEKTDEISAKGGDILSGITDDQTTTNYSNGTEITAAATIQESGSYKVTGNIAGQIKVKSAGVKLYFDNCNIISAGKKVIDSDYDLINVLMDNTVNTVSNVGEGAAEANAISGSGDITVTGGGALTILSTKSGIKGDSVFYGLGGTLTVTAGTGHGISADTCIVNGATITVNGAAKDGLHAETEDEIIISNPVFDDSKGYVYIAAGNINVSAVYGDGIQADTFVLIDGGSINISTLPTFVKATSSSSCYRLSGGVYSKVAAESSSNYSSLYQLQQSCKGIKVGEIDYTVDSTEYVLTDNTSYSLIIGGGTINIDSTDDALHSNSGNVLISGGAITLRTADDGVSADKSLRVSGGTLNITASYEGLEGETIDISGGTMTVVASDDGINAASDATTAVQKTTCYIKISGGVINVNAGGDGIDSNGGCLITGGEVYVYGPTSGGDASLDTETGMIINGGTLIAVGSSGMVETPATNSQQYCVSINLASSATGSITVKSGDTVIASFLPNSIFGVSKNYQSIVLSSPLFEKGKTYSVVSGNTTTSVTISGIITKVGTAAGPNTGGRPR